MQKTTNEQLAEKKAAGEVTLTIDGQEITVTRGTTVLEAARKLNIHIPTFCWHPKLKSVGACRMCYVEVEKMPKLAVSCATEVMDGMVVHTDSEMVKAGRKAVIEFILANHPLDCPTCDKGGECDLQDLTFAHGLDDSRFAFRKMRFTDDEVATTFDDVKIGPEIVLNRNRCILCYKCVRANKEAFGEFDLGAFERGNITEINSAPGEEVDNPYSGNLVEICPVGALTNSDWRYKIRVWLTKTTASICNFTSSGTNILFWKDPHKNHIYRVTSNRNDDIDDGWLADLTRYGYQIVTSKERLTKPLIMKDGKQVEATWEEALNHIHKRFVEIKEKKGAVCIGGLAAPNLDNASLYSFQKFFRAVLKSNNIDFRSHYRYLPETQDSPFGVLCAQPFRINQIDDSDVIFVFGSDLVREHHNEYLRIRKAYNFFGAQIYSATPYAVKAADIATLETVYKPGTEEALINGLCLTAIEEGIVDKALGDQLKAKVSPKSAAECAGLAGVSVTDLKLLAQALADGKKVTVIIGELVARSKGREAISEALGNLNKLFDLTGKGQMAVLARYANSVGAERLGLVGEPLAPIKSEIEAINGHYPECPARTTDKMLALAKKEEITSMFLLGGNPMEMYPDREFVSEALGKLDFLVACDLFETETTERAEVVLPLCSWAEHAGDYINLEGRVQRANKAIEPMGEARPGVEIINELATKFERPLFESDVQMQSEIDRLLNIEETRQ
ncbi:NADH-quinone oxidoreductase subunit NuoG, partial [candidate division GN15 bacterium]|nr:NADH-quinone oxidoreductase subunit NuoG [candidate division GN15 bacterium]